MKNSIYLLLVACLTFSLKSSSCQSKQVECTNELLFEVPFNITAQDTFKLGDTIWIAAQTTDLMVDKITNKPIQTNNLNLATEVLLGKIYPDSILLALNHFSVVQNTGIAQLKSPGSLKMLFDTTGKEQKIRFGLIPKVIGGYIFIPDYFQNSIDKNLKLTHSDCIDVPTITYRTNNGICNFNILKYSKLDHLKLT